MVSSVRSSAFRRDGDGSRHKSHISVWSIVIGKLIVVPIAYSSVSPGDSLFDEKTSIFHYQLSAWLLRKGYCKAGGLGQIFARMSSGPK